MLMERVIGAFTFRTSVYAEVEQDTSFTQTAWLIVGVIAFVSQLGANAARGFGGMLIGAVVGTVFALLGFGIGAWAIAWAGRTLFQANVTFEEMVRVLGLAYVWNVVAVIGIVALFGPALACVLAPITIIAALAGLVAMAFAAKEALDLDWVPTIISVLIGWVIAFILNLIAGAILGLLGFGVRAAGDIFTGR